MKAQTPISMNRSSSAIQLTPMSYYALGQAKFNDPWVESAKYTYYQAYKDNSNNIFDDGVFNSLDNKDL